MPVAKSLRIEHGVNLGSGSLVRLAHMAKPSGDERPERQARCMKSAIAIR